MVRPVQVKISQKYLEELRKHERFLEFHIRPNIPAEASKIREQWLVRVEDNTEYWLQPE